MASARASTTARRRSQPVKSRARRAERRAGKAKQKTLVQRTARAGLCARGLIYLVLGLVTVDVAFTGGRGPRDSSAGVIEDLARQPAGPGLVVVLALGLIAYSGWRLLQAVSGDPDSDGFRDWARRIGWGAIGGVYAALFARAVSALLGQGGQGRGAPSYTGRVLSYPGGREVLTLVGLAVIGGAVGLMTWAVLQKFETYLPDRKTPAWVDVAARAAITGGNLVRGAVFGGVGASLVAAGVLGRAQDAKDFDQALRGLAHQPYGPWLLVLAALGFLAFSAASVLEAAYRQI